MKRISFPDSDCSRFMFHKQCGIVVLIAFALVGLLACERTPDRAPEAKKAVADKPGMVHLTTEELARTVIEVTPVARGALLVPRQYTATVQANKMEQHIRRLIVTIRWDSVPARVWRYPHQTEGRGQIVFSRFGRIGREGI